MGFCFSCKPSSSSSPSPSSFKNIRVVHLNGYVEEFEHPVTVSEVTGKPSKHFVFTQAQLLSSGSKHLKPDNILEPGHVYFLLPYSTFQSDVSPIDLAPIARKLSAIAKNSHFNCSKAKSGRKVSRNLHGKSSSTSCRNRFSDRSMMIETGNNVVGYTNYTQRSQKSRSWKPILSTIRELSFNRRSESDLQEKCNGLS